MGKIKDYLFDIAQDIYDSDYISDDSIDYDSPFQDNRRVISIAVEKYIKDNLSDSAEIKKWVNSHKEHLVDMVADILSIPGYESELSTNEFADIELKESNYEMPSLYEKQENPDFYDLDKLSRVALNSVHIWLGHETFMDFKEEVERQFKEGADPYELRDMYHEFLNEHIYKFFQLLITKLYIEEDYLEENKEELLEKIIKESFPLPEDMDREEDPILAKAIKQSLGKTKPSDIKDYSKMTRREIEDIANAALDNNDIKTLKELQPYIHESLKSKINEHINDQKYIIGLLSEGCNCGGKKNRRLK